jgi:hypothetical protein
MADPDSTRERYEGDTQERSWDANVKRTYDEYQQESLESIRRNRTHVDKMITDAQQHDNQRQTIANHALELAVSRDNEAMLKSQKHGELAMDHLWNPIQQGAADVATLRAVTIDDASLKAIGAMVAAAVAEAIKPGA